MRWYRSRLWKTTETVLSYARSERCCFDTCPNAWRFSGASMPESRTRCCCRWAVRTVRVSPSATPTTRPINWSAQAEPIDSASPRRVNSRKSCRVMPSFSHLPARARKPTQLRDYWPRSRIDPSGLARIIEAKRRGERVHSLSNTSDRPNGWIMPNITVHYRKWGQKCHQERHTELPHRTNPRRCVRRLPRSIN